MMAHLEYDTEAECIAAEAAITAAMNLSQSSVTRRWAIPYKREDGNTVIANPADEA